MKLKKLTTVFLLALTLSLQTVGNQQPDNDNSVSESSEVNNSDTTGCEPLAIIPAPAPWNNVGTNS